MKLKIIEAGWVNFTGNMGGVDFVDSVSVGEVSERQAFVIANLISVETLEGVNPSSSQQALAALTVPMEVVENIVAPVVLKTEVKVESKAEAKAEVEAVKYSRAQLEAIADAKGVEGVREIAKPMGLYAKSINGLIDQIINKQGGEPIVGLGTLAQQQLLGTKAALPGSFLIDGKTITLGAVIRLAFEQFEKEGRTVDEWNDQSQEVRDQLVSAQLDLLRS